MEFKKKGAIQISIFYLLLFRLKRKANWCKVFIGIDVIFFYCSLESSGYYASTSNAFIFSLRNKEGIGAIKSLVTDPSHAINRRSDYGPTFGGPTSDIYIASYANSIQSSFKNFGHSFSVPSGVQDPSTILAGALSFTLDEWEVFYLDPSTKMP